MLRCVVTRFTLLLATASALRTPLASSPRTHTAAIHAIDVRLSAHSTGAPPPTIDAAKKAFQAQYGRVADAPQQTFINEIIYSTQYALIAPNYAYSRVFAVGYEALCDTFLLSTCRTPADGVAIRASLLTALSMDEAVVASDAKMLLAAAEGKSEAEVLALDDLAQLRDFAHPKGFKYTYTFGAGMITLMRAAGVEPDSESIERWCGALKLGCAGVLTRDYSYFKSNIEKMEQLKEMMVQLKVKAKRDEAKKLEAEAAKAANEAAEAEAARDSEDATAA